jgi:eukaryotic-like serine/threonine-protein kinase
MTYGGGYPGGAPDPFGPQNPFGPTNAGPQTPGPYGGPAPGFGAAPPPPPPPESSTLATLSVVFAFVFAPAGAVLGHLALAEIHRYRRPGRDRALVGLTLSYTVIVAAAVSLVVWTAVGNTPRTAPPPATAAAPPSVSTAPPTPTPPPGVPAAALPGFLLTIDDVKRLVNTPNLNTTEDDDKVFGTVTSTFDPPECATVVGAYELLAPDPIAAVAGPMVVRDRMLSGPVSSAGGLVAVQETVIRVDTAATAHRVLADILERWHGCAGKTVISEGSKIGRQSYSVEQPATLGAVTTLRSRYINDVSSDRAVAAKGNILVELSGAVGHGGSEVAVLAQAILDRIPG